MTISASIPAAVVSMGVLRLFRRSNILENNIVQTAASAGESLAAGVIFTLPALIILDYWTKFDFLWVTIIAGFGGLLGVLFTIPLRRALIVEMKLKFPEGIATAEVLRSGERGGSDVKYIAQAAVVGGLFKLGAAGLRIWAEVIETARSVGGSIAYFGSNLSPALLSVGYIVGLNIAVLVFLGGALNWCAAAPIIASQYEWPVYQLSSEVEEPDGWNVTPKHPQNRKQSWNRTTPQLRPSWANRLKQRNTRGGYGRSEPDTSALGGCSSGGYGPSSSCERLFSAASEAA
jgi:putative OPT family oligopeptide transporter